MPDTRPLQAPDDLYDTDFARWAETQAALVREFSAGHHIDARHIAEELEGLAARERRELSSRIATIIEHLLKLQYSRAAQPRSDWQRTIARERDETVRLLEDSRCLWTEVSDRIARETPRAGRAAQYALAEFGEALAPRTEHLFTPEEVLGEWFPQPPVSL